jgi:hypothetical protein
MWGRSRPAAATSSATQRGLLAEPWPMGRVPRGRSRPAAATSSVLSSVTQRGILAEPCTIMAAAPSVATGPSAATRPLLGPRTSCCFATTVAGSGTVPAPTLPCPTPAPTPVPTARGNAARARLKALALPLVVARDEAIVHARVCAHARLGTPVGCECIHRLTAGCRRPVQLLRHLQRAASRPAGVHETVKVEDTTRSGS